MRAINGRLHSAVRSTRKLLQSKNEAARVGVIDDVGFLDIETDIDIDKAVMEQRRHREAYARHRQERHGSG